MNIEPLFVEIAKLSLKPTDILVAKIPPGPADEIISLHKTLTEKLPGIKIMVTSNIELSVIESIAD